MSKQGQVTRGFTLIELLVVIAIIGLLSSIVLASLNSARSKGRDAARLAGLHQLSLALELFYNDRGVYPPSAQATNTSYCSWYSIGNGYSLPELLTPTYIPKIPLDPKYPTSSAYGQCLDYFADQSPSGSSYYRLYETLENPSAQQLATMNAADGIDPFFTSRGVNYKFIQVGP